VPESAIEERREMELTCVVLEPPSTLTFKPAAARIQRTSSAAVSMARRLARLCAPAVALAMTCASVKQICGRAQAITMIMMADLLLVSHE